MALQPRRADQSPRKRREKHESVRVRVRVRMRVRVRVLLLFSRSRGACARACASCIQERRWWEANWHRCDDIRPAVPATLLNWHRCTSPRLLRRRRDCPPNRVRHRVLSSGTLVSCRLGAAALPRTARYAPLSQAGQQARPSCRLCRAQRALACCRVRVAPRPP